MCQVSRMISVVQDFLRILLSMETKKDFKIPMSSMSKLTQEEQQWISSLPAQAEMTSHMLKQIPVFPILYSSESKKRVNKSKHKE